jgi:hypothetical protein
VGQIANSGGLAERETEDPDPEGTIVDAYNYAGPSRTSRR